MLVLKIEHVPDPEAIEMIQSFIEDHPTHLDAKLELAKRLAFSDPERAQSLISSIKMGEPGFDVVEDVIKSQRN